MKSKFFKRFLLIGIPILVLGTVLGYIVYHNYLSEYSNVVSYQQDTAKRYAPVIKKQVKKQLGITPKSVSYDVNPTSKEITSAVVHFSSKDVDDHPFLKSDYFYKDGSRVDKKQEPKFTMIIWEHWPKDADISDIIATKVNQVPTEVFLDMVRKGDLEKGFGDPPLKRVHIRTMVERALTKEQNKILLQNYYKLSKLKGQDLAVKLMELKLVEKLERYQKIDKKVSSKNMAELVKNGKFYLKNLQIVSLQEPRNEMDIAEVRPFSVSPMKEDEDGEDGSNYTETGQLNIYDSSRSIKVKESQTYEYNLYDVTKINSNKYHAFMHRFEDDEVLTFEVEILLNLDAKEFN